MTGIIDTHTHLYDRAFAGDLDAVLDRARAAGVRSIVSVSETLADAQANLALSRTHPIIRPAAGLYPAVLDWDQAGQIVAFIRAHRGELAAIGEVGLDYWVVKDPAARELQQAIFGLFIDLSLELDLPLNVHSRSAGKYAIQLLRERGARRVQLHAFDGRAATALPAVAAGYLFSVPPSVVRSVQKQKLVSRLPLECLMVETDSPVLGPDPQVRNEPANILHAIDAIAGLKDLPREVVMEALARNSALLYGNSLAAAGSGGP